MNAIAQSNLGTQSPADEAGASDNRLSLDPSDPRWKDILDKWQDGQSYEATIKINQVSPGEYEVEALQSESETPAESGPGDEQEAAAPAAGSPDAASSAMSGMM